MIVQFNQPSVTVLRDRTEAGHLLSGKLTAYRDNPRTIILALPRGGVPVGFAIHQALGLPLDAFITRKLGFPGNPEYALGAVTETGYVWLNQEVMGLNERAELNLRFQVDKEIVIQKEEIDRQRRLFRNSRSFPNLGTDWTVILVDDGIATGSTFLASLHALREMRVTRIIAALPVGPFDTLQKIATFVDHTEVLLTPDLFQAVGNYYVDFSQVEDSEVIADLAAARCHVSQK